MAATNHTKNLNLSLWDETDKPERLDFVNDNNKIESAVSEHTLDTDIHITAELKDKLKTPFVTASYTGTGSTQRTIDFTFEPTLVIVFIPGSLPFEVDSYGTHLGFMGIATQAGSSRGLSLSGKSLTVSSIAYQPDDTVAVPLFNNNNAKYQLLIFK